MRGKARAEIIANTAALRGSTCSVVSCAERGAAEEEEADAEAKLK